MMLVPTTSTAASISPMGAMVGQQSLLGETLAAMLDIAAANQPAQLDRCHLQIEHPCADTFRAFNIQSAHLSFVRSTRSLRGDDREGMRATKQQFFEETRQAFSRRMLSLAGSVAMQESRDFLAFRPHEALAPQSLARLSDEGIVEQAAVEALSISLANYLSSSLALLKRAEAELQPIRKGGKNSKILAGLLLCMAAGASLFHGKSIPDTAAAFVGETVTASLQFGLDMLVPYRLALLSIFFATLTVFRSRRAHTISEHKIGSGSRTDREYWLNDVPRIRQEYFLLLRSTGLEDIPLDEHGGDTNIRIHPGG